MLSSRFRDRFQLSDYSGFMNSATTYSDPELGLTLTKCLQILTNLGTVPLRRLAAGVGRGRSQRRSFLHTYRYFLCRSISCTLCTIFPHLSPTPPSAKLTWDPSLASCGSQGKTTGSKNYACHLHIKAPVTLAPPYDNAKMRDPCALCMPIILINRIDIQLHSLPPALTLVIHK